MARRRKPLPGAEPFPDLGPVEAPTTPPLPLAVIPQQPAPSVSIASEAAPESYEVRELPVDDLRPNPFQTRVVFENINALSAAIRTQGFTTVLMVRPDPDEVGAFQIAYGERRLRAARQADLESVPCVVTELTDDEMRIVGLSENLNRQSLSLLEEARALHDCLQQMRLSLRGLASQLGVSVGYIENRVALLRLPTEVQALVAARPGTLDAARQIGRLANAAERRRLVAAVLSGTISSRQVRAEVNALLAPAPGRRRMPARAREWEPERAWEDTTTRFASQEEETWQEEAAALDPEDDQEWLASTTYVTEAQQAIAQQLALLCSLSTEHEALRITVQAALLAVQEQVQAALDDLV